MKIESPDYGKFVKSKNKTSNFLIALHDFLQHSPFLRHRYDGGKDHRRQYDRKRLFNGRAPHRSLFDI